MYVQVLVQEFSEVLEELGYRGIFCSAWSRSQLEIEEELYKYSDNLIIVKDVPHEWLFPHCSMVNI